VVVEDPPGLGGSRDPRNVANGVEEFVRVARANPAGTVGALLEEKPDVVAPGCGEFGQEPADARRRSGCPATEDRSVEPSDTRPGLSGYRCGCSPRPTTQHSQIPIGQS
jgi:hypothetical protein